MSRHGAWSKHGKLDGWRFADLFTIQLTHRCYIASFFLDIASYIIIQCIVVCTAKFINHGIVLVRHGAPVNR